MVRRVTKARSRRAQSYSRDITRSRVASNIYSKDINRSFDALLFKSLAGFYL